MTEPQPQPADEAAGEQLALVKAGARRTARAARAERSKPPDPPAAELPVARVVVDVPLAHLDRPFDYLVRESQAATAVPGARVRVRFAGQELDGFVLERCASSEFGGRLAPLPRVVSPEPVLAPQVAALARLVADRWGGTRADVLRLAVPPRHATAEKAAPAAAADPPAPPGAPGPWARYDAGPAFLDGLAAGRSPRAVWTALPGEDWAAALAVAVHVALAAGRGALVVLPDQRDVDRLDAALTARLGAGQHVALTAELGPAERYRRFLAVRRGAVRAVVGTRAAAYAPVADLGLVAIWDDGDDLHAEPHAPYAHARDVLTLRAHEEGAGALLAGFAVTAEAAALLAAGWARAIRPPRAELRAAAPRVRVAGDDAEQARDPAAAGARLPHLAWRAAREGLERGPVLVQVPRRGYVPTLACQQCRAPARCPACSGPLGLTSGHAMPTCRWCGRVAGDWRCPVCEGTRVRAVVVGSGRTAEELGRAFPKVPVRTSGGGAVLDTVPDEPALVVATPGAEPVAAAGYAAALLLDGWALLDRPDLRAGEEALRRWLSAAALVRPARDGGQVVLLAAPGLLPVESLVRWDPLGHAERELVDRAALRLPPAARVASLTGARADVEELLALAELPAGADVLGPVPVETPAGRARAVGEEQRAVIRAPRAHGAALAAALKAAQGVRSARKGGDHVRVQIDPLDLG
ncbi:MAG: primosomal protein N' [Motilibacteraceae bacterium]